MRASALTLSICSLSVAIITALAVYVKFMKYEYKLTSQVTSLAEKAKEILNTRKINC